MYDLNLPNSPSHHLRESTQSQYPLSILYIDSYVLPICLPTFSIVLFILVGSG